MANSFHKISLPKVPILMLMSILFIHWSELHICLAFNMAPNDSSSHQRKNYHQYYRLITKLMPIIERLIYSDQCNLIPFDGFTRFSHCKRNQKLSHSYISQTCRNALTQHILKSGIKSNGASFSSAVAGRQPKFS